MDTLTPGSDALIKGNYSKRKLRHIKKRRRLRRTKILMNRLRFFGKYASFIGIVWLLFFVVDMPQWYLNKNVFQKYPNANLEIEGTNIVTKKQVIASLKDFELPDKPIYLINTKPIENAVQKLSPVKKVIIRRYWNPARLRIVVDERTPVISISPSPKVAPIAVFTKDADKVQILGNEYLPLPEGIKTYKVITYDDFKSWRHSLIPYIEYLAMYLESATEEKLVYLDVRNPDDAYAQMENIRLRLGNLNGAKKIFKRIDKVTAVIPETVNIRDNIEYIDLRWDNVSIKLKNKEKES